MKIKNETEIQLMKILFKTQGKATKNMTSKRAYPFGVENKFYRQLKSFFKPLTDYVSKFLNENIEGLLRGDSEEIKLDSIPGKTFRNMIYNLENWLAVYMPELGETNPNANVIFTSLNKTAEDAKIFGDKEFQKTIEKGIHINPPVASEWWNDMKNSWAEDNYTLITSNAKNYVSKINTLTEQAIVNGLSPMKLKEQIMKATESLSDKHCKLLARDQMGKLNGQITQAQMQEVGLDMYVWSTSYDDRVRDSHAAMEGLLCRYDDASVCSYDNGKTWEPRPSNAVDLHPGQDIQCRCVALAFYPELVSEMEGTSLSEQTEGLPDVQDLPQFQTNEFSNFTEEELKIYNDAEKEMSTLLKYDFNDTDKQAIYKCLATQDFSNLPKDFFEKKDGIYSIYLKDVISKYYPEKTNRNILAIQNQIDLIGTNKNKLNFSVSQKTIKEIETIYEKNMMNHALRNELLNKYSFEELLGFSGKNINDYFVADSNYLALSKYFKMNGDGISDIVRKGVGRNSLMYTVSQAQDVKNISDAFIKTGFKYTESEYRTLAERINSNILPKVGTPWGTAEANNVQAHSITLWDTRYRPFNKATQQLSKEIKPNISIDTLEQSIANKKYATQLMQNKDALKSTTISYKGKEYNYFKNNEFLRMDFDFGKGITEYKVGDIIEQTGVFATSPSELHNAIWTNSKLSQGAKNPVRFHLPQSEKTKKLASLIVTDDLGTGTGTTLNPEEIDFAVSKVKITKIEDGFINTYLNGKETNVPIKEIWVDIIE